jgi:hypothetical protein
MKLEKSDALKLKYEALRWLRLEQRCPFIATEAGAFSADALGINEKKMVEVECKRTLDDLRNDFRKPKHTAYSKGLEWDRIWIPNQFYFAVTPDLVEAAQALVAQKAPAYGIISQERFRVVKRAQKLHDREPSSRAKFSLALRMGSELIRFHEAWV